MRAKDSLAIALAAAADSRRRELAVERRLAERQAAVLHERQLTLESLSASLGGVDLTGSANVSHARVAGMPAYAAGVKLIGDSVASLPIEVVDADGAPQERSRIAGLFKMAPNAYMSAYQLRRAMVHQLLFWGNAYYVIEYDRGSGNITGLLPRDARTLISINVNREFITGSAGGGGVGDSSYDVAIGEGDRGGLYYTFGNRSGTEVWPGWQILHIRGETVDGLVGISPIRQFRESMALMLGARDYASETFTNGGTPLGIITNLGAPMGQNKMEAVTQKARDAFQDRGKRRGLLALDSNIAFQVVKAGLDDMQFLQTREFDVSEVARMLNIHPSKLGIMERTTYDNMERFDLDYAADTLGPILNAMEGEVNRKLGLWKRGLELKHDLSGVIRETNIQRYRGYKLAIEGGWMTPNEAREREGLQPIGGLDATVPIDKLGAGNSQTVGNSVGSPNPGAREDTNGAHAHFNGARVGLTNGVH